MVQDLLSEALGKPWHLSSPTRVPLVATLVLVCVGLAFYFSFVRQHDLVYTHLFYLPILLVGFWYQQKAFYIALLLGAAHVIAEALRLGALQPAPLLRAGSFLAVGITVGSLAQRREALRRAAADSEARLRTILNSVYDAILIHRADGSVLTVNDKMLQMFRVSREEAVRHSIAADYSSPANPVGRLPQLWQRVIAGESHVMDWEARRPGDGSTFPAEVFLCRLPWPEGNVILATIRDITERKRAAQELEDARARAEFYLSLMAHDLRNVNQVALLSIEQAASQPGLNAVTRRALDRTLQGIRHGTTLIDTVTRMQQARTGELKPQPLALPALLAEVIGQYGSSPGKQVTIAFAPVGDYQVLGHELVRDIFGNLLDNAIKHSPESVLIQIELSHATVAGKRYCRATVDDNGPGLPDGVDVFERRTRGRSGTSGSGLGLWLVKTLVTDLGGLIWAEPRMQGDRTIGTRFVVLLPSVDDLPP